MDGKRYEVYVKDFTFGVDDVFFSNYEEALHYARRQLIAARATMHPLWQDDFDHYICFYEKFWVPDQETFDDGGWIEWGVQEIKN